mgnify:CR=1 FL=1
MTEFETLLQALIPLVQFGFMAGVVIAVVVASAKIGFKIAPWILIGAALIYFLG